MPDPSISDRHPSPDGRKRVATVQDALAHAAWLSGRQLQRVRHPFPVTQPEGRPRGAAFEGWNRSSGQSATAVWRVQLEERDEETGGADRRARGPANLTRWRAPACVTTPDCPVSRTLPSSSEPPFPIALRFPSPRLSRQYHILTHRWHLQPRRSSLPCRPGLRLHTRCVRHHRHP